MKEYKNWRGETCYEVTIDDMLDKTFTEVRSDGYELIFENSKERFTFYHKQDCCENVYIESITGDLTDLENSPILVAEEATSDRATDQYDDYESRTWTFYKFATRNGYVDVRFLGTSNGYYSESVSLKYDRKNKLS